MNKIYTTAKNLLGQVLSDGNAVYGCAITVCEIIKRAGIQIDPTYSTIMLFDELEAHPSFTEVSTPLPGDIIISPTGYGMNPKMPHGHTGIVAKYGILSNSSEDGKLHENYTLESWKRIFVDVGGYPIYFFRAK